MQTQSLEETTRICRTCHLEKDISFFYKTKSRCKGGRVHECKSCAINYSAEYHKINKDRDYLYHQAYNRKRDRGVTQDEYESMLLKQNGVCAICDNPEPSNKQCLSVDHSHNTHTIRGLLCSSCNIALGHAKDNPDLLEAMARYLRAHNDGFIAST